MYRCRRLIAIVLSLAVVASTFIIFASAEDSEFSYNYITINNNSYMIENGVAAVFQIPANGYVDVSIPSLRLRSLSLNEYESLSVNFHLRAYAFYSSGGPDPWIARVEQTSTYYNPTSALFLTSFQDYDRSPELNKMNKTPYGIIGSFLLSSTGSVELNYSLKITNRSSTVPITVYLFFEDVDIHTSWNYNMSHYLIPSILGVTTAITFANNKLFSDSFTYTEISYDQQGNASTVDKSGNWITAVLGTLNSLLAPVQKQVEEEQMAKDAGFNDVLDDAYENSSPGSIIDFLGIGSISSWNEEAYEDAQSDAITYWFSQSCKDNIDSVPVVRGEEPQIIDFYSSHISEYWEALGIDTANSCGN